MSKSKKIIEQVQRFALYLFFFSINFEIWDPFNTSGLFSVSKLTGWLYLCTIILQIYHFNRTDKIKPFLLPLWFFFGILTTVSLINVNIMSYDFFDFSIFQNIFLFWFLLNHERKEHLVLEKGMLSFALGSVSLALLFYAGIGIEYDGGRVKIFGDNQNGIGLRMSISMAILVLATVQNRLKLGKVRYLLLLPIPIMLRFMAETGSRVAFFSFALSFVTGVVLFKTKRIMSKIPIIISGLIALIYSWVFLLQSESLAQRLLRTYEQGDLGERDVILRRLLPLIESNPIIGVGKTGYYYFLQTNTAEVAHNVIIEVLCYTGIIGLLIYLLFLFRVFKNGYQNYKREGLLLPLLLISPVFGMLVSGQILYAKIATVIFAYIAGSSAFMPKPETVSSVHALITHRNHSICPGAAGKRRVSIRRS